MSPAAHRLCNELLHRFVEEADEASLLAWRTVSRAWCMPASVELHSRPVHVRAPGSLLKLLDGLAHPSYVMPRAECLQYMRSIVFHSPPAVDDPDNLRLHLIQLAELHLQPIHQVTLKYPAITKVVDQEEMIRVNVFMRDLLTVLQPRSLAIVGETSATLPYANLLWQPERIIIGEDHSYEHMLPLWLTMGDKGVGARSALTAVTIIMSGVFRPRDQPMLLPHRIKGRFFRLLQLLEHICSFASITFVGIGAISPVRILLNPEIHFNGPIGPWTTTLPGCTNIDFDTERENQDAIAECLKQVAIASGFCTANEWLNRVSFCTHPC